MTAGDNGRMYSDYFNHQMHDRTVIA